MTETELENDYPMIDIHRLMVFTEGPRKGLPVKSLRIESQEGFGTFIHVFTESADFIRDGFGNILWLREFRKEEYHDQRLC